MLIQKHTLLKTVSLVVISSSIVFSSCALAAETSLKEETNVYRLQLMTQIFDGQRDFSQSQKAAIARVRKGEVSHTLLNFGDSAVVIEDMNGLAASHFDNVSGIEAEFIYNYETKTLSGKNQTSDFFNKHIRKYLQKGPELGSDAQWNKMISLDDMNIKNIQGGSFELKLKRDYFTFEERDYVLLHYQIPAFTYKSIEGQDVIHWGEGGRGF